MKVKLPEILYKSFDQKLSSEEELQLAGALVNDENLRRDKKDVEEMRRKISLNKEMSFSSGFSNKIMDKISNAEKDKADEDISVYLLKSFKKISLIAAVFLFSIFTYNMVSNKEISVSAALSVYEDPLTQIVEPVNVLF